MIRKLLILLVVVFFSGILHAAEVKNLQSRQEGNRVLFEFDLVGDEEEADVTVGLTVDGKEYKDKDLHLEGDYGKVKVGKGKKIYWNVLQDFPRGYSGDLDVEITAGPNAIEGMVFVKGGCFQMGDLWEAGSADEKPVHEVCLDDYYIDKTEVTQKEYKKVMGNNPSMYKGNNNPVEKVKWHDANNYCIKAGKKLPTEAEWEYAARSGGKKEEWAGTNSESGLGEYGWYNSKSTHPVGQKKPNGLGIYDMNGNVWEWVSDWYGKDYYKNSPKWNPKGPDSGDFRVWRGGCFFNGPRSGRNATRYGNDPDMGVANLGFRCAGTP